MYGLWWYYGAPTFPPYYLTARLTGFPGFFLTNVRLTTSNVVWGFYDFPGTGVPGFWFAAAIPVGAHFPFGYAVDPDH